MQPHRKHTSTYSIIMFCDHSLTDVTDGWLLCPLMTFGSKYRHLTNSRDCFAMCRNNHVSMSVVAQHLLDCIKFYSNVRLTNFFHSDASSVMLNINVIFYDVFCADAIQYNTIQYLRTGIVVINTSLSWLPKLKVHNYMSHIKWCTDTCSYYQRHHGLFQVMFAMLSQYITRVLA